MSEISQVEDKIKSNEPLTFDDGLFLMRDDVSLHRIGMLADSVRWRFNGIVTYYNVNTHLNPTNLCISRCPLCAFRAEADSERAKTMTFDEVKERANEAAANGSTEIHIVGGLHPEKNYDWYRDIITTVRNAAPKLHIKAWAAPEIDHFTTLTSWSIKQVLRDMIAAGLNSMPGGGAEIFADKPRQIIAPRKINAARWLEIHRAAHKVGLSTNATMLFGHVETKSDRIDHLIRLRELQTESLSQRDNTKSAAFNAFVPLVYQPHATLRLQRAAASDILRTIAVSRVMLNNIPHIKAYWVTLGLQIAQIAQAYGADDMDGTINGEKVHREAGTQSPDAIEVENIKRLIKETGHEPTERDSEYSCIG
ncbi:MAG: aminofutalosine synthase MqnE [Planctomycetaceae bacterium]|nr:aminofutalosine synthase MqnE [Planctomycetaceae bacterium]